MIPGASETAGCGAGDDAVPPSSSRDGCDRAARLIGAALFTLTLLVFLPVWHHEFVAFDDPLYVTGNRQVQAGLTWRGLRWAFTTSHAGNWHPLTWLSHMADVQFFGHGATGPHLMNVLLHAMNAVLVFALLRRCTGATWRSAIVAAFFALHPLRVESVAWVSERKDVLSACFFLLSVLAYARYAGTVPAADRGAAAGNRSPVPPPSRSLVPGPSFPVPAFWSLVFFVAALLAKPMAVTLPCVLLLLDYWPFRRFGGPDGQRQFGKRLREKLPFFAAAAGVSVVTFLVQRRAGAIRTLDSFSFDDRIANALVSFARYLGKTVWPTHLAAPYPLPAHWPAAVVAGATVLLVGLASAIWFFRHRVPYVVTGALWFAGMLVPTIGLIQLSDQAMADRYTYLPSIGLFVAVAWGAAELARRFPGIRRALAIAGSVALVAAAGRTIDQLRVWRDTETLSRHALAHTVGNAIAHNNLGNVLLERGATDDALAQFQAAVQSNPSYADARINLANALLEKNQPGDAIAEFRAAIQAQPYSSAGHYNLGNALLRIGRVDDAIAEFGRALELEPDSFGAHNNLANAMLQTSRWDAAILHYRAALELQPDYPLAHHNLGIALRQLGRLDEAVTEFRLMTQLQPHSANVYNNLGWMLQQAGQFAEAVVQFQRALELQPAYAAAHDNLGRTLWQLGRVSEAMDHLRTAVKLEPGDARNVTDLAWALATTADDRFRNGREALALAEQATRLSPADDLDALRVRAAAQAESGDCSAAATTAARAIEVATARGDTAMAEQLSLHLAAYKAGVPFRERMQSAATPPRS